MLPPDSRTTAFELLRAPCGYRLDFAVLTTYTLDLEALLVLPLSVLAYPEGGLEELLADPLRLHQALRDAGDRVHVFVDEKGIAIPRGARALYSMLESSVHPVRAPNGGAFHPKLWVARFTATDEAEEDETGEDLLRVAVLSRNLTFDRSWDVALSSEAALRGRRRVAASRPLHDLLRALPQFAEGRIPPLPQGIVERVEALAAQVRRTEFPAPDGFDSPIRFHAIGLAPGGRTWRPPSNGPVTHGHRTLAVAPFVNRTGLDEIGRLSGHERILVSRQEALDRLPADARAAWKEIFVLSDAAQGEAEDGPADTQEEGPAETAGTNESDSGTGAETRPSGLHAKMIAVEHGRHVTWSVGSANLTAAAFTGRNVEMMASITGRKGRGKGANGCGIDRFLDAGFQKLLVEYKPVEQEAEDPGLSEARDRLETARDALVHADLRVVCASDGDLWTLKLDGSVPASCDEVEAVAWPVSVREDRARPLDAPPSWKLPPTCLTAFIAFRLSVPVRGVDDIRMTLRLPADGMPADRMHRILRTLLDSPEKFLRFLRALLGGLDAVVGWAQDEGGGDGAAPWGIGGAGGEPLLDELVRTASRDPARLEPVRRMIDDLRKTEEGRRVVPDDLFAVWKAVEEALAPEPPS